MKRICFFIGIVALLALFTQSCNNGETYADKLDKEKEYINDFINEKGIQVINESNFDPNVKMEENEYVLFQSDGIYMHIDSLGTGSTLYHQLDSLNSKQPGVRLVVLTRFLEYSLQYRDTMLTNLYYNASPEQFYYAKNSTSYMPNSSNSTYGKFFYDSSITSSEYSMINYYGTTVPGGWLKPLQYVGNGGRVKVIVPSKMGTSTAATNVLPYFYELRFQLY